MSRSARDIVLFSGGIGSWGAARRLADSGVGPLTLLFTDTLTEDEDLYRFLREAADDVGGDLIWLSEGRDVWEVFFDAKMIGNNRAAICSRILKREQARHWIEANTSPEDTTVYLGLDWSEEHRYKTARPYWEPWVMKAPLCDPPYLDRADLFADLRTRGIDPPRLYAMGFPHNNCGGFCVRAGHGTFAKLLEQLPERFAYHEAMEQKFRDTFSKDVSVLRDRTGGTTTPLTLTAFREQIESGQTMTLDFDDLGGCGCMTETEQGQLI